MPINPPPKTTSSGRIGGPNDDTGPAGSIDGVAEGVGPLGAVTPAGTEGPPDAALNDGDGVGGVGGAIDAFGLGTGVGFGEAVGVAFGEAVGVAFGPTTEYGVEASLPTCGVALRSATWARIAWLPGVLSFGLKVAILALQSPDPGYGYGSRLAVASGGFLVESQ
jgi:hypothetical protein